MSDKREARDAKIKTIYFNGRDHKSSHFNASRILLLSLRFGSLYLLVYFSFILFGFGYGFFVVVHLLPSFLDLLILFLNLLFSFLYSIFIRICLSAAEGPRHTRITPHCLFCIVFIDLTTIFFFFFFFWAGISSILFTNKYVWSVSVCSDSNNSCGRRAVSHESHGRTERLPERKFI